MAGSSDQDPLVILGAGYAGLMVATEVYRRARRQVPIVLVDRSPAHVLRTELYEIGRLASARGDPRPWTVPLDRIFEQTTVATHAGTVQRIDLEGRAVELDTGRLSYGQLAIGLGNVAAYYGVPGAAENSFQVYRLSGAQRLASEIVRVERASADLPGERRPRIVVVGGGSTGTEVAAEIATTDWTGIADPKARTPDVYLVTGALPFLAGFAPKLIERARNALRRSGVTLLHGYNVQRIDPGKVSLEDGSVLACDLVIWCAGLEAPDVVRSLDVAHGRGGRIRVEPTLRVPGHPGVYAVGDVAEIVDPTSGATVPATAQAARQEARTAAANLVAERRGGPLQPFQWRERGVLVALGIGQAAGQLSGLNVWGSPAAVLKRVIQRDYARSVERGEPTSLY
jgi:NADH:ubiquinone reductase (H+-translocating)